MGARAGVRYEGADREVSMSLNPLILILAACASRAPVEAPAAPEAARAEAPERATEAPGGDVIRTSVGDVRVRPLFHATFALEHGDTTWVVDPWSQAPLEGVRADVVLVTDIHQDHLDPQAIASVSTDDTITVGPPAVGEQIELDVTLANGESAEVAGVGVLAVPAYNLQRGPAEGAVFHDRGRGNGYVLTFGDTRVYVAGDTECTPEMRALEDIDVAFVPMNLPYTMPPAEAAECVRAFAPRVVYPYHSRDSDVGSFARALEDTDVEVRIRDWYAGRGD